MSLETGINDIEIEATDNAGNRSQITQRITLDNTRPTVVFLAPSSGNGSHDKPMTLRQLGQHFGFSRERARQLEIRAKERLKANLSGLVDNIWGNETLTVS